MVGKEPFEGPVTIDVEGIRRSLGIGVAEMVRVEPA
jgi:Fe2+ transport system protein FeoA